MRPFMLYHWSPRKNREGILRRGLCPGRPAELDGGWKAPWVCFARYPTVAWALSATHSRKRGEWDLWCCWSDAAPYTTTNVHGRERWWMTEYRVGQRIPKRMIWHVGTRMWVPNRPNAGGDGRQPARKGQHEIKDNECGGQG